MVLVREGKKGETLHFLRTLEATKDNVMFYKIEFVAR